MSLSPSRGAYGDCYKIMDQAVSDPVGIRIRLRDEAAGVHLRMRMNQARAIDRSDNAKTYDPGHYMYNRSPYDALVFRAPAEDDFGNWWLVVDKPEAVTYEIESLSDGSDLIEADYTETLALDDLREDDPIVEDPIIRRI